MVSVQGKLKIVFMGTPEWAIPSLKAVIESGIEVSAVSVSYTHLTLPTKRIV